MMELGVPGDGVFEAEEAALDALPDDPPDCPNDVHNWTRWRLGRHLVREERFCMGCGWMETQEFKP